MKNSGIDGIGEIPIDWNIIKLKKIIEFINGYAFKSSEFTSYDKGDIVITISSFSRTALLEDKYSYSTEIVENKEKYLVKPNDILLAMSGGTVGKNIYLKNVPNDSYINQRVGIIRSSINKYIFYWINSSYFDEYVKLMSAGSAQPNISSNDILNFKIAIPDSDQVKRIIDVMDYKSELINKIISATEQSIEELKKYKQSIIVEAVTKGLDSNVDMKDSGIEWVGNIPKHWVVKKVRFFLREVSEKNHPNEKVLSLYRDYGVIPKDSRDDNHNVTSLNTANYKLVKQNQVVINKMKAWQGSFAISKFKGIISPAYYIYEIIDHDIYPDFLHYVLRNHSYLDEYRRISSGLRIGQWDLDKNEFKNLKYTFPKNVQEQKEIVSYLDTQTKRIDALIQDKEKAIKELEQYKKSIIYEYLTGKRKV